MKCQGGVPQPKRTLKNGKQALHGLRRRETRVDGIAPTGRDSGKDDML